MGEWIPMFRVTGGLYGGYATPNGDMNGFISEVEPYVNTSENIIWGSNLHEDPADEWAGGFGSSISVVEDFGDSKGHDGVVYDVPFFIFTIPNPDGAQFYRQDLVIAGKIRSYGMQSGGIPAYVYETEPVTTIYRREFYSPTSMPTITHTFFTGHIGDVIYIPSDPSIPNTGFGYMCTKAFIPVSYGKYNGHDYLCIGLYIKNRYNQTDNYRYQYAFAGVSTATLAAAFGDNFGLDKDDDPNIDPNPPSPEPGDDPTPTPGDHEKNYDPIPIPDMPGLSAIGAGFLSLYSPSKAVMNLFAAELYSDNILQIISNYFTNIQDMVAGLSIIPFAVPVSGFAKHRIGLFTSDISMPVVSSQFIDIDCGSINVKKFYNNFLDYAPNTKLMLWLPYIGYQELNADEVMDQVLSVKYRCDVLSGACVAFVMIGSGSDPTYQVGRVIAQFTGNVINQVPVAAASYDNMVSSAINILTASVGIAAGAAIGGAGAGMIGAAKTAETSSISSAVGAQVGLGMAGTASNMVTSMKPNVVRNGTPGSTAGYMGVQKPYLIKIVPRSAVATNHIQLKGYPSNYGGTLAGLTGYCEVSEIQLKISASEASAPEVNEKTEIYSLLKGGVII